MIVQATRTNETEKNEIKKFIRKNIENIWKWI